MSRWEYAEIDFSGEEAEEHAGPPRDYGLGFHPDAKQTCLLVVPQRSIHNPHVWSILGFSPQQSERIINDRLTVMVAPRPLMAIGHEPGGTGIESIKTGEVLLPMQGGIYPDAPFCHGRFYVAGDPHWLMHPNGSRTMADSWRSDDAWVVLLMSDVEAYREWRQHATRDDRISEAELDSLMQRYKWTPAVAAGQSGWPMPVVDAAKVYT